MTEHANHVFEGPTFVWLPPPGPISMAQGRADPNCTQRVMPACRRQGSSYSSSACTTDVQYFAWPARRIVEIARRFSQSTLCGGSACGNGFVSSICASDYGALVDSFARRVVERAAGM